jgi:hypothetical protein
MSITPEVNDVSFTSADRKPEEKLPSERIEAMGPREELKVQRVTSRRSSNHSRKSSKHESLEEEIKQVTLPRNMELY